MIGLVALWESPLVPDTARYCEQVSSKSEICTDYDITYYVFWRALSLFDEHSGSVIAAFTIVLATFTIRLALATDRLVMGADDTARRQLRAYVRLVDATIISDLTPNTYPIASVALKNGGLTPAYNFTNEAILVVKPLDYTVSKDMMWPGQRTTGHISKSSIGRDDPYQGRINMLKPLLSEQLNAIRERRLGLYLVGEAFYTDTFGQRHEVYYRMLYSQEYGGPAGQMIFCTEGNYET